MISSEGPRMIIRAEDLSPGQVRSLFEEAIAPRPLAIVSTTGAYGVPHLYVLEWYSSACPFPPMPYFTIDPADGGGRGQELLDQLGASGDFVLNGVDESLASALPVIQGPREPHASEFSRAGLTAVPSSRVRALRVRESPTHMECHVLDIFQTGNCWTVLGGALEFHLREDIHQNGKIKQSAHRAIGRVGHGLHCRCSNPHVLQPSLSTTEHGLPSDAEGGPG
ncbi:flavin reductase family protein [Nonomuraea turcica]|uniref:flavin reductase family protein n=1 Tax=Nonomuraea sp. G32 TaxID=3067274 RepID=UPI00353012D2